MLNPIDFLGRDGIILQLLIYLEIGYWRGGRVAEGAPLLREYGANNSIEGSNPSLSARRFLKYAPVAQLDRVPGYEPGGRRFESFLAHHTIKKAHFKWAFLIVIALSSGFEASLINLSLTNSEG